MSTTDSIDQSSENFNLRYRTGLLSDEEHFTNDNPTKSRGLATRVKKRKPLTNEEIDSNFLTLEDEMRTKAPSYSPIFSGIAEFSGGTAIILPNGGMEDRPSEIIEGMLRYNTESHQFEGVQNGAWQQIGGGATGGGNDKVFYLSDKYVSSDYDIPENKNAMAVGEIVIGAYRQRIKTKVRSGSTSTGGLVDKIVSITKYDRYNNVLGYFDVDGNMLTEGKKEFTIKSSDARYNNFIISDEEQISYEEVDLDEQGSSVTVTIPEGSRLVIV